MAFTAAPALTQATFEASLPKPAANMPPATALDGSKGASSDYARADHTHAACVQRTVVTTASDGTFKWTFARPIVCAKGALPPISYMVDDTGSPVVVQVFAREFTSDGTLDTHASVTIKAQRARALPATLSSLLALVSYDVFGVAAAGSKVSLWASDPTQ